MKRIPMLNKNSLRSTVNSAEAERLKSLGKEFRKSIFVHRLPRINIASREGPLALSFAQQRLWFLDQLEGASATYNMPMALRLHGHVDESALRRSLDALFARHEALRTVFAVSDGGPCVQLLDAHSGLPFIVEDLSGAAEREE